jgi:hypothetical protein
MNTENNKLIAEFLGYVLRGVDTYENNNKLYLTDELKFNDDWNWLMEVVEKIETLKYYKNEIQFKITKNAVSIQAITKKINEVISKCVFSSWGTYHGTEKKEAVYKASIEFINWYNEQTFLKNYMEAKNGKDIPGNIRGYNLTIINDLLNDKTIKVNSNQ